MSSGSQVVCLHDRAVIEAVLRRNVFLNIYALGDLGDFFWPHTTWYGLEREGRVEAVCLLFSGLQLPCLLAVCDDDGTALRALLHRVLHLLPVRFYCHLSAAVAPLFTEWYALESHGLHLRMGLREPGRLATVDTSGVERLSEADRDEILALYAAANPGTWFELLMLKTGQYVGLRVDGRLVSIAGVHVYAPEQRVAALGNIATHPDCRGRGYATRVTAALCRQLLESCDHVGLNVKADNAPAIRCYEKLGFALVAEYEECTASLASRLRTQDQ